MTEHSDRPDLTTLLAGYRAICMRARLRSELIVKSPTAVLKLLDAVEQELRALGSTKLPVNLNRMDAMLDQERAERNRPQYGWLSQDATEIAFQFIEEGNRDFAVIFLRGAAMAAGKYEGAAQIDRIVDDLIYRSTVGE